MEKGSRLPQGPQSYNRKPTNSADNQEELGRGPQGPAENHGAAKALTEDLSELCLDS